MSHTRNRGFTLIEMMIVIAVLGIVVAVGYPSYTDHIRKSRRAEGMAELLELADRMERHYSDYGTYDRWNSTTSSWVDMTAADVWKDTTTNGYYTLVIPGAGLGTTNVSFTARAQPTSKGGQDKDKCGIFQIDANGTRAVINGNGYTNEMCWR